MVIGDGSGSMWGWPIGWGAVMLTRGTMERKVFWGGMNDGTVNVAELMAYVVPMAWYAREVEKERALHGPSIKNVHIITDSTYLSGKGESDDSITNPRNSVLWHALATYKRHGILLHWHWLPAYHEKPAQAAALNHYADSVSKVARMVIKEMDLVGDLAKFKGLDPYKLNPWQ